MNTGKSPVFEFGPFVLDASRRVLLHDGTPVALQPKAFEMLLRLVERRDVVLSKDELLSALWPDTFVDEANLSQNIYVLRKALGQEGSDAYIQTVPKRGYRFVADVRERGGAADLARPTGENTERANLRRSPRFMSRGRRKALAFAALGLLLCAFAAFGFVRLAGNRATPLAVPRSMAVLPFKRLSPQAGDEYLGVGLCDVLITKLSTLHHLVVRPTSAVLKYEAPGTDTVAAGRELHTEAVLEGSLQRDADRLRVTVRLINVADGVTIWAETFDERSGDVFKVQDAIAGNVVRALAVTLGQGDREQLSQRYTSNTDAYQLYMKGRYFWAKRTEANTRKSIEYFERAIALDPEYALAYTGLADAYWTLHFLAQSGDAEALRSRAKAAALKALALDDTLAEAHTSLGVIKEFYDLDFAGAESEYKRALALNPNHAVGHHWYGALLLHIGRIDEAKTEFGRALALDPLSPAINTDAARPFIRSRDYPRAIEQLHVAVEIDPSFPRAHNLLAFCYTEMGRYDEAAGEAQRAAELFGPPPEDAGAAFRLNYQLAYIYARAGRAADARRVLEELEASGSARGDQVTWHALTYAALGDRDRAFLFIEKLYETRNPDFVSLKFLPQWDSLRDDARFQALMRRSGLTP
jgi:DNA-binding winged helix-turn-helix (wHTH) protein/TolB-like protein/Flp pilus assembly protein TadD